MQAGGWKSWAVGKESLGGELSFLVAPGPSLLQVCVAVLSALVSLLCNSPL